MFGRVFGLFVIVGIGLSVAACGTIEDESSSGNPWVHSSVVPADSVVELMRTVELDPTILLSHVSAVDVGENGRMLVADRVSRGVFEFFSDGTYASSYGIEECDPGAEWRPEEARYGENGDVVVRTSVRAYWFAPDGTCIRPLEELPIGAKSACFSENLIIAYSGGFGTYALTVFNTSNESVYRYSIPEPEFPNLASMLSPIQAMSCTDDDALIVYPESADALEWSSSSGSVRQLTTMPGFFRSIRKDMVLSGDGTTMTESLMEIYRASTAAMAVYSLGNKKRAVVHRYESGSDQGLGFTLASDDNLASTSFVLSGKGTPVGGHRGQLLVAHYPEWSDSLTSANPRIDFYRVKP